MTRLFLSYSFRDEDLAERLCRQLRKQPGIEPFLYAEEKTANDWRVQLVQVLPHCDVFVFVCGSGVGQTQEWEINWHIQEGKIAGQRSLCVVLPGGVLPDSPRLPDEIEPIRCQPDVADPAKDLAMQIATRLTEGREGEERVSRGRTAELGAAAHDMYSAGKIRSPVRLQFSDSRGPLRWPIVKWDAHRLSHDRIQKRIGKFGGEDLAVTIAADTGQTEGALSLLEAHPRRRHRYPLPGLRTLKVGIVVSGTIAPGTNAAIKGIVERHEIYQDMPSEPQHGSADRDRYRNYELEISGYRNGLKSLLTDDIVHLTRSSAGVADAEATARASGSLLGTSRFPELDDPAQRDRILADIAGHLHGRMDILYVIGGDGSMRAAHGIWKKAQELRPTCTEFLSVIGIPKAIDNDILWVPQSFGFGSANERTTGLALDARTEVDANPRLCIAQVRGSESGFVAAHAALSSRICDAVLIPEVEYSLAGLFDHLQRRLYERARTSARGGLVILAEAAIPSDALQYVRGLGDPGALCADDKIRVELNDMEKAALVRFFKHGRRLKGSSDPLHSAGLKIVSRVLQRMIEDRMRPRTNWQNFRVLTIEPRHLIRSARPNDDDLSLAQQLGALSVDNAMAGYTDFLVSRYDSDYVLVPLDLSYLGRQRVDPDGPLWKSVLASTGQPPMMTAISRDGV